MDKLSAAEASSILKENADTMRDLIAENKALRVKVAASTLKDRAQDIAEAMEDKGILPEFSTHEKVAHLLDNIEDLPVFAKMAEVEYMKGFASLGEVSIGQGLSSLERFIITGDAQ